MHKNLSFYLHLVRFSAAFAVLLDHSSHLLRPFLTSKLTIHGSEAVAVFFVLSGFMMRHVTNTKEDDASSYSFARLVRISSVAPLAIMVGLAADALGRHFGPAVYDHLGFYHQVSFLAVLSSLTFTNELWFAHAVVGTNEAYWSLGFEVQYYIFFGLLLFAPQRARPAALVLWAAIVGPKILLYLPLWLLGALVYDIVARRALSGRASGRMLGAALFAGSIISYAVFRFVLHEDARSLFHADMMHEVVHNAVHFYIVGILFGTHLVGFSLMTDRENIWPKKAGAAIKWVADGSFTLYLTHEPLLIACVALWPATRQSGSAAFAATLGVLVVAYLLSQLGERRKDWFHALFSARHNSPARSGAE